MSAAESERSIVISALRAALDPAVARKVAGQLDVFLELELSGTSVQTKVRQPCACTVARLHADKHLKQVDGACADRTKLWAGASLGSH